MNDRLNEAVELLLLDSRFLRRFRRNPEKALRPYGLSAEEVAAVKRGDAGELLRLGLDPSYIWPKPRPSALAWLLVRGRKLTPALVLAALLTPAAPALAAPRRSRRGSPVGRVSRYFARSGVGGRFHARLARAGRAGRLTARAARRADTSRYLAAARRTARRYDLTPPPGSLPQ